MRLIACLALALSAAPAFAADRHIKATFIGPGVFATEPDCRRLEALAAGAVRNLDSVPEKLTEDGIVGWENGCFFTKVTEQTKGRVWVARMNCGEGAQNWRETRTFRPGANGSWQVTLRRRSTQYLRCETKPGQ